jgi:hypothetical protein
MSKVGPTSSTAGKPRRVTANWAFESAPRPKADLQSANRKSSNQRTLQLEMSDVRKLEVSLNAGNICAIAREAHALSLVCRQKKRVCYIFI